MPTSHKKKQEKSLSPKKRSGRKQKNESRADSTDSILPRTFAGAVPVDPLSIDDLIEDEDLQPLSLDADVFEYLNPGELHVLLMHAIIHNEMNEFLYLLAMREQVDPTLNNEEALCASIEHERAHMVAALLADGRASPLENNRRPIMLANQASDRRIASMVIKDQRVAHTIFLEAIRNNEIHTINKILTISSFNPGYDNNRGLIAAIEHNHLDVVKRLLEDKRMDASLGHNHALMLARSLNRTEIAECLCADVKVKFKGILINIYNSELESFQFLFDDCFNPSKTNVQDVKSRIYSALWVAIDANRYDVFKVLLTLPHADLSCSQYYLLEFMCAKGQFNMLADALGRLHQVNMPWAAVPSGEIFTLLKASIDYKNYRCLQVLLSLPNVNLEAYGEQILLLAMRQQDIQSFTLLIQDRRANTQKNNYILYKEAIKLNYIEFFECLYANTSFEKLNEVSLVVEQTLAEEEDLGNSVDVEAIRAIQAKYQTQSFMPLYGRYTRTLKENQEVKLFIQSVFKEEPSLKTTESAKP